MENILIKVFLSMIAAILAGWLTGPDLTFLGIPYLKIYTLMGQLFINALHLVVMPLVSASIILGTARIGADTSFTMLGAKTIGFYLLSISSAVFVGIAGFFLFFSESSIENIDALTTASRVINPMIAQSQGDIFDTLSHIFFKLIPSNILAETSQGQMLGLIFFCILFGFFLSKIEEEPGSIVLSFWNGIFQIMMKMTNLIMKALPVGVFGLVAKVVATTGLNSLISAAWYFFSVVTSLLAYSLFVIPLILIMIARVNPILLFRAMLPAFFTAFSTSSSAATLPVTMECLERRAGISNRICNFTIPLGTSLNMPGGALYLCMTSLFLAKLNGLPLTFNTISLVVLMASLTSMGVGGIPSASPIPVVVILNTIGVPIEGIGFIFAVERIIDMFRTTVNVMSNTTCAVLLASSEGENGFLTKKLRKN